MSNDSIKERLATLEEQVSEIKTNHLVHLQEAIEKVDARTWIILVSIIVGFLAQIALSLFKS